jgi:hypothetical protein
MLRILVVWIRSIYFRRYNGKNIIIYVNMDVILIRTFSRVIIMTKIVDPHTEKGAGILIKENSIEVRDERQESGKALLISSCVSISKPTK